MTTAVLQGWEELENRFRSKLLQLTGLLQHIATSDDAESEYYQNLANQHDTEIGDILQETVSKVQCFRNALELQVREDSSTAISEALFREKELMLRELDHLKERAKEREAALDINYKQKMEPIQRELNWVREVLTKNSWELNRSRAENSELTNELEELKRSCSEEIQAERTKSKYQFDEIVAKHEVELQEHKVEVQESLERQHSFHDNLVEGLRVRHNEALDQLKMVSEAKLSNMEQNFETMKYDLIAEKHLVQERLNAVYKEREDLANETALLKGEIREAQLFVDSIKAHSEQTKSLLEEDISLLKEDNAHLEERLQGALSDLFWISAERKNADLEKTLSATTFAKMGDTLASLKWDLEKMTANCKKKDETIDSKSSKIEQLQAAWSKTQKELDTALAEVEKERYRLAIKDEEIQEVECKRKFEADEVISLRSKLLKKDETVQFLEFRLHTQSSEHELKLKNLTEDFAQLDKEEKEKHEKEINALQLQLNGYQAEHISSINLYQKKIEQLESQLQTLELTCEKEVKSFELLADNCEAEMKRASNNFESKLESSLVKYLELHQSIEISFEKFQCRNKAQESEIEMLRKEITQLQLTHNNFRDSIARAYSENLQRMEDEWSEKLGDERESSELAIQRLNEKYANAIEVGVCDHQRELSTCKAAMDEQKTQEINDLEDQHRKQIEKLEAGIKTELRLQMSKLESEHKTATDLAAQQQQALVIAHEHALEIEISKADLEIRRLKEAHAREISIELSLSTEKAIVESLTLHEDHKKRLEELSNAHNAEVQKLQDTHAVESEKQNSKIMQLNSRLCELESLGSSKDKKIKELHETSHQQEKRAEAALKDSSLCHEKALNCQKLKSARDKDALAKALEGKYRRELDVCNAYHASQYETLQQDLNRSKALMRQKQSEITDLQEQLSELKERFENRESRPADVERIASLELERVMLQDSCDVKESVYQKLKDECDKIRMELLNREENYNKIFRNSRVVQQGTPECMKSQSPSRSCSAPGPRSRQGKVRIQLCDLKL